MLRNEKKHLNTIYAGERVMNSSKQRQINVGFSLVKILMSFVVIVDHFGNDEVVFTIRETLGGLAVPCFMFMSFYLIAPKLDSLSLEFVLKRLKRLYFPVVIWSFFSYVFYSILFQFGIGEVNFSDWRKLFYSLLFGSAKGLVPQFWFNITQIIIFIIVAIVFSSVNINKNEHICISFLFIIIAFLFQYSNINGDLFSSSPYEVRYTLGRIAEMMPFAFTAILIYKKENTKLFLIGTIGSFWVLVAFRFFLFRGEYIGFGYSGIATYALSIFICTLIVSLNFCPNNKIANIINHWASLSAGVYYMHYTVGVCIEGLLNEMNSTFICDILIWMVCLLIVATVKTISNRYCKCLSLCIE